MGVLRAVGQAWDRFSGGWPGTWRRSARGLHGNEPPPFVPPADPDDRRSLIPPLGLREYWYPALPAKDIGWKKPVGLKICGIALVFFKDQNGAVQALWDYCPHRGVYLSWGDCFWKGFVSCPYHGATFNGEGECVAFIPEGPDSKMPGRLKARKFPTVTLKGLVFVWMGEGEPVPPEEDIPPEFFDERAMVLWGWQHWKMNWMIALENTMDAHNAFWVHRNSLRCLGTRFALRPRTPVGYRVKVVNNKAVMAVRDREGSADRYYADKAGKIPYQMYYPGLGYWPLHRWRLLWVWFFEWWARRHIGGQLAGGDAAPDWLKGEWGPQCQHLPSMMRMGLGDRGHLHTRWCIPVEEDYTRILHTYAFPAQSKLARLWARAFHPVRQFMQFNFSSQDGDAAGSVRYQYPEFLSSTDSYMVALRKLVTEHGRGIQRPLAVKEETTAERLVVEADTALGVKPDVELVMTGTGGSRDTA